MRPSELVRSWVEAFNAHRPSEIAALYHEDAVNHQVAQDPVAGRAAIEAMFAREFAAADMVCMVENIFEDADVAILEWRDPMGLRGCGIFHVRDGKIVLRQTAVLQSLLSTGSEIQVDDSQIIWTLDTNEGDMVETNGKVLSTNPQAIAWPRNAPLLRIRIREPLGAEYAATQPSFLQMLNDYMANQPK